MKPAWRKELSGFYKKSLPSAAQGAAQPAAAATAVLESQGEGAPVMLEGQEFMLRHGNVVIAAITSCTNTSNPSVMLGAGLLARKALARGLSRKPWVKTSLRLARRW